MGFDKKFIKQYTSEKIFTASHFRDICLFCNCKCMQISYRSENLIHFFLH